jgi:hypothetical protein
VKLIHWELPPDRAQFIINKLGALPFNEVAALIADLVQQSNRPDPEPKVAEPAKPKGEKPA